LFIEFHRGSFAKSRISLAGPHRIGKSH
jgi:hypothetical protein